MSWILKKYLADFAPEIQTSREMGMEFHLNLPTLILLNVQILGLVFRLFFLEIYSVLQQLDANDSN